MKALEMPSAGVSARADVPHPEFGASVNNVYRCRAFTIT